METEMSKPVAELRGAENLPETVIVGDRAIAVERRAGRPPGLFWLSGFRSDMAGSKATAVDAFGNTVEDYNGKIHFSGVSTTGNLVPADYAFTAADAGVPLGGPVVTPEIPVGAGTDSAASEIL